MHQIVTSSANYYGVLGTSIIGTFVTGVAVTGTGVHGIATYALGFRELPLWASRTCGRPEAAGALCGGDAAATSGPYTAVVGSSSVLGMPLFW
jgi:hypothetical protein